MSPEERQDAYVRLIEKHQHQLLDLSFRNRLLNAKPGRLLLDCACSDPGRLEDLLAGGRRVRLVGGKDSEANGLGGRSPWLALPMDQDKADGACLNLYRHTQTRLEETGLQALHLGIGALEYREPQSMSDRPRRMPIIMLAVSMSRRTARSGFAIESNGDPAEINATMLEWLRREYAVNIDDWEEGLPCDDAGIDVDGVLGKLAKRLEGAPNFSVKRRVVLGYFEFQKFAMHRDLDAIKECPPSPALAAALGVDGVDAAGPTTPSLIVKNDLDARFKPGDLLLPLQSDAHQAAAAASAAEGASFILKGPPGTGKSQTIANLVAHLIGAGKSVLFCAEKAAALDAVQKRLTAIGLDRYCLDLHQRGKDKSQAAKQIGAALDALERDGGASSQDAVRERESERLAALRTRLNAHAEAVGCIRPNGRSLVDAIGLSEGEALSVEFDTEDVHDEGRLDDLKGLLRRGLAAGRSVRGLPDAWRHVRFCSDLTADADAMLDAARSFINGGAELKKAQSALAEVSMWRSPLNFMRRRREAAAAAAAAQAAERSFRSVARTAEQLPMLDAAESAQAVVDGGRRRIQSWGRWVAANLDCLEAGVEQALTAAHERELPQDEALARLERGYWRYWSGRWIAEDPALDGFSGESHEADVREFRRLQEQWDSQSALKWINARVCAGVQLPDMDSRDRNETQRRQAIRALRKEAAKSRRHKPVRKLLAEAGDIVRALKPCFMMSPLSVAQYLTTDFRFDLLIFDESSQIRPWDALGAMARADQVVLAGDDRQMPPTSFFDKQSDAEGGSDDGDEQVDDLESALDMAAASGMPTQWLKMHYRSATEELIAFSNHKYYDRELIMMPTPVRRAENGRGLVLLDPDGEYVPGAARTNPKEAKAVVEWAVRRLRERSSESLGIVTFNQAQQRLIEDLLDTERMQDPELNARWEDEQPPFVKNLETVQGDERDVIALSVTWAADAEGRQYARFGPLGQRGGERRLNVALTRARREMVIFCSLDPDKIPIKASTQRGVVDLKHFLEFARDGMSALGASHGGSEGDYDSPFEKCVAETLRRRGWMIDPQVGTLGYRVDLGVVDPSAEGRYLAGVECDGAAYHSSASARERDKQRQEVLESKGWRLIRIWSTDWWREREAEASRVDAELRRLSEQTA